METHKVSDFVPGFTKATGRLIPLEKMIQSPSREAECLYYDFEFKERVSDHTGRTWTWLTLVHDKKWILCGLDDGTGVAEVDLQGVQFELGNAVRGSSDDGNISMDEIRKFLKEKYDKPKEGIFNQKWRFAEEFLDENDVIYIIGEVTKGVGEEFRFRKGDGLYTISNRGPQGLDQVYQFRAKGAFLLSLVTFLLGSGFIVFGQFF